MLPWQEALQITAQVALALDAANAHGVVHRDIKPQNIMITHDGVVKVLDFGIARARALPSLTQSGFVGSPYYISPEQAMGEQVDVRSDIYSLGVALYEMLSGKMPFDATSPWSIINKHIAQKPLSLSLVQSGLPPRIEDLVNRMLSKDPGDRHQTPTHLLQSIRAILQGKDTGELDPAEPIAFVHRTLPLGKVHNLLLNSLYDRAVEAAEEEKWPQAVNLLNRIVKLDPDYKDASERLSHAGRQARLAALYAAAHTALERERLQEAVDELGEIVSVNAEYRDAAELLTEAGMALAEIRTQERVAELYTRGRNHYLSREWQEAQECLTQVYDADPNYRDITTLYADARRRARWSRTFLGRVGHRLTGWIGANGTKRAPKRIQDGE
jgi:hypothetical protein